MPRQQKMKRLEVLTGIPAAELQYGVKLDPRRTRGVVTVPATNVTPDEQALLRAYALLPPFAQEALRVRAVELLEQFGEPGAANPFGNGKPVHEKKHKTDN